MADLDKIAEEMKNENIITSSVNPEQYVEFIHPLGLRLKTKQTIASRASTLRISKRKACMVRLPKKFSLKEKFPPAYLQKYGSCSSNAVLACDDMIYHGSGKWKPSGTFTYYNQRKLDGDIDIDEGSTVEEALIAVKKFGACSAKIWPDDKPFNLEPSHEAYVNGKHGHEVKKWYVLKNKKQVKQALVSGYPVAAAFIYAYKGYDENFVLIIPTKADVKKADSGHAMVIVGYDDEKKVFELRNSWGTGWGNEGYIYMPYEMFDMVIEYIDTYAVVR